MRVSTISLRLTFISDAGQPFWQHEKKSNERLLLSVACSTNFKPDATTAMGYTLPYFSQFAVSNTLTTDTRLRTGNRSLSRWKIGAPERSRTPNPQIRSLVLYP